MKLFESPEDIQRRAKETVNSKLDPDFEKKYEAVKPALELFEKTGYSTEQQRINAEQRKAKQAKEDNEKIQSIRASLGLAPTVENIEPETKEEYKNPFINEGGEEQPFSKEGVLNRNFNRPKDTAEQDEEIIPNYTEVHNDKTGRSILFPKEAILNNNQEQEGETKYVEVKNEKTGRSILFSKEAIEDGKKQSNVDEILRVPNELANNLKKEEQILSHVQSEIEKTQDRLENFSNPQYIDRIMDQYNTSAKAAEELQFEFDALSSRLEELRLAEEKTKEAIDAIEQQLAE